MECQDVMNISESNMTVKNFFYCRKEKLYSYICGACKECLGNNRFLWLIYKATSKRDIVPCNWLLKIWEEHFVFYSNDSGFVRMNFS